MNIDELAKLQLLGYTYEQCVNRQITIIRQDGPSVTLENKCITKNKTILMDSLICTMFKKRNLKKEYLATVIRK